MQIDGIRTRHFRIRTKTGFHQGPLLSGALWALMPLHYRPLRYKNRREHRRFRKGPRRMREFGECNISYSKVGQVSVRKGWGYELLFGARPATFLTLDHHL